MRMCVGGGGGGLIYETFALTIDFCIILFLPCVIK